ncbi:MAG: hypothetical protein ACHQUC_00775 [Chlamydiales bacterium]
MKIFGDYNPAYFKTHEKEQGFIFGYDDVLKADKGTTSRATISFLGSSYESWECEPKLYLHIPTNLWSSLTGKLREYCLPWRWKAVYLDKGNSVEPRRILICTEVYDGGFSNELTHRLKELVNQSWFVTNLISNYDYQEILGREYITIPEENSDKCEVTHFLGKSHGCHFARNIRHCHIYRKRGLLSTLKYLILKNFSPAWQEVTFRVNNVSEKVLIRREDRTIISQQKNYIE